MTREVRPNLFIVGAPKCGTTSLHAYLGQHPQIFMASRKEPQFWSDDLRAQGRAFHREPYRRHFRSLSGLLSLPACIWHRSRAKPERALGIERLDQYLALFKGADTKRHQYIGEASAENMWSEVAARRIAEFCPEARIIILLREPLSYIVSMHRESLSGRLGEQVKSLQKALSLEARRRAGDDIPCSVRFPFSVCYRLQAHFDEQVQRFLDVFDRRQICFVLLEDLAKDAVRTVNTVLAFLGLPATGSDLNLEPRNVGDSSGKSELGPEWRRALLEEMTPVVARLELQTGVDLRARWGYLN